MRQLIDRAISIGADTDKLFATLPAIGKAKLALQLLLEGDPNARELAESVLLELEDLEIENLLQEAALEGVIDLPKGAYIVWYKKPPLQVAFFLSSYIVERAMQID